MKTMHAAVWLDHSEARIFHLSKDGFDEKILQTEKPHRHLHRKSGPGAVSGRRGMIEPAFYEEITRSLSDAEEILVLGPSTAKLELIRYAHKHSAPVAERIIGVETVDHPSDRQIVAYARQYFEAADQVK
jgi:hypothetical protein